MLAVRCRLADTFRGRLVGWIGHAPAPGEALWLRPCASVHTLGLGAAIDVVFCGAAGEVRRVVRGLPPGRLAGDAGAAQACELPCGGAAGVARGDHLDLTGA